jgi:hypothetical protein
LGVGENEKAPARVSLERCDGLLAQRDFAAAAVLGRSDNAARHGAANE